MEARPLTRIASQSDLSPAGRGERSAGIGLSNSLLHRREAVHGLVPVEPAGIEPRGGKVGTVRRVRPGLRLQAKRVGLTIEFSALAGERAVEEVAGIELQA